MAAALRRYIAALLQWPAAVRLGAPVRPGNLAETLPNYLPPSLTAKSASFPRRGLRQSRLRATVIFCLFWWTAVTLAPLWAKVAVPILPGAIALCLAGCLVTLSRRSLSPRALTILEVFIFTVMAAGFGELHYRTLAVAIRAQDVRGIDIAAQNAQVASSWLLFLYAMLIPNSWKRAAPMVGLLSIYPAGVLSIVALSHPEMLASDVTSGAAMHRGMLFLQIIMTACLALYGVHILETLRYEIFESRRLNQYQLGNRLGGGSMGDVYLAEHRLLKRACAIKLIRSDAAKHRDALVRFEREVQTTARLSHPNIVDVYDYGRTEEGTFYYVMEYLHGYTLQELVERFGPLPPCRVMFLLRQACSGLREAHAAGLIHRDLKPANIFVAHIGERYDVTKLLDFGLVHEVHGSNGTKRRNGTLTGTPLYMSPEQATGSAVVDGRADIYALGGAAYYMMTGCPPFEAKSVQEMLFAHACRPVTPPRKLRTDIPSDLERIVLRCLEKDQAKRFQNAEALDRALSQCAAAECWTNTVASSWWNEQPDADPSCSDPIKADQYALVLEE